MRIIINADDCGASKKHTEVNLELLASGRISGTTFMVNTEYSETAVRLIKSEFPVLIPNIGLHLNLTSGRPLNPAFHGSPFVDKDNQFCNFRKSAGAMQRIRYINELRKEVDLQVDWFHDKFGRYPAHMDSHNHVYQASPDAFYAVITSRKARYIRHARPVRQYYHDKTAGKSIRFLITRVARGWYNRILRSRFLTVDYFTDIRTLDNRFVTKSMLDQLAKRYQVIEFMCHPYYKDESEYTYLKSPDNVFLPLIRSGMLISYDSLQNTV